jgi:hypothetical protein
MEVYAVFASKPSFFKKRLKKIERCKRVFTIRIWLFKGKRLNRLSMLDKKLYLLDKRQQTLLERMHG